MFMLLKWTILLKIGHFPDGRFSFMTADAVLYQIDFFLNRIFFCIESILNRMVSATSPSKIEVN